MDPKKVFCKYYMNGVCRESTKCTYSHDSRDKPSMVCKFYLQGNCSYGSTCRYDHVKRNVRDPSGKYPSIPKPIEVGGVALKSAGNKELDTKMVKLTKKKSKSSSTFKPPANWADAPVFVPGQSYKGFPPETSCTGYSLVEPSTQGDHPAVASYSQAAQYGLPVEVIDKLDEKEAALMLCPFAAMGHCKSEQCSYLHGLECEMCGNFCLNPYDPEQQEEHKRECLQQFEKNMEYSFALQRSEGVSCGVCLEVVLDRQDPNERRFGILSDCTHSFCLSCIRKWRNSSHTEKKIVRACPICRVPSGFVTPSEVWIEDREEKEQLINAYKTALWSKPCKYFAEGKGTCPFGTSCFYRHAYPDGRIEESQLRRYQTAEGKTEVMKSCRLWDFVQARDLRSVDTRQSTDDLDDLL